MKRIIVVIALMMYIFLGEARVQEQSTGAYVDPSGKYSLVCPDGMVMDSENKDGSRSISIKIKKLFLI